MTINYNTSSWLKGSYEKDALNFIGWFENPALMKNGANLAAHFEGTSIALGYGYDLIENIKYVKADLAKVGVTITNAQIKLLNEAMGAGTIRRQAIATQLKNGGVVLPNPTAAENLFKNVRIDVYEKRLNSYLIKGGFTGTVPESRERIALLSLTYAGHLTDRDTAGNNPARRTLTGIATALQDGNRQEVWFWIRYRSNYARSATTEARNKAGYTKRAYAESELFGIFDNENTATYDETVNIYKILQKHRKEIYDYEKKWGTDPNSTNYNTPSQRIAAANNDFQLTGDYAVKTLAVELEPAKTVMLTDVRNRYNDELNIRLSDSEIAKYISTNIYLSPDANKGAVLDARMYEKGNFWPGSGRTKISIWYHIETNQ